MSTRVRFSLALGLSCMLGCGDDASTAADSGVTHHDASTPTPDAGGSQGPRVPVSIYDAGPPGIGEQCALLVGAECDGNEDCQAGQQCCGTIGESSGTYETIKCQDTCAPNDNAYQLCHPGESCQVTGRECLRSSILPYEYYLVCRDPADAPPEQSGDAIAGEINCGAERCGAGQKCCLRSAFDLETKITSPRKPYCAALDAECECDFEPIVGDAGQDDDAG